jgi:hypothetical protein
MGGRYNGPRDPCKMSPKQREWYFSRPRPSSLSHPWTQDLRSEAEMDRDRRDCERHLRRGDGRVGYTGCD